MWVGVNDTRAPRGGGNTANAKLDRSRPSLRWMVFEAGALGLRTAPFLRPNITPQEQVEFTESLKCLWWLLETLPFKRLTYSRLGEKVTTRW